MDKLIPLVIVSAVVLSGLGAVAIPLFKDTATSTPSTIYTIHTLHGTSADWAGYVVATTLNSPQNNAITDVKGSWIVPTVSGSVTPNAFSASWIGIDGYASNTVEQIGTDANVNNGVAVYAAWYEMFPKPPVYLNMTISAGDTISAEVNYLGMGKFRLSITDVTTGETFSTIQSGAATARVSPNPAISGSTGHVVVGRTRPLTITDLTTRTLDCNIYHNVWYTTATIAPMTIPAIVEGLFGAPHRSSAEWILEAPSNIAGQVLPLADFGTASFFDSQVTVNGVTGSINDAHWQNDAITMQTSSPPIIKAQPSLLSADGTSFSVTWLHE